jgi:exopolyphosphatase/pppGpp-phosphohydrolase
MRLANKQLSAKEKKKMSKSENKDWILRRGILLEKCIHNHVNDMDQEALKNHALQYMFDELFFADSDGVDEFIKENQYKPF